MFARTCVFSKQSLPTGLCGHHTLSQASWYKWMAPLLPKLRGHFAEFLHHDSLDLLSILYLTTCVGLGYGPLKPRADAFLGSIGSPASPYGSASHLTQSRKILLNDGLHAYTGTTIARHRLPSCVTPVNTLTSPHRVPTLHTQHTRRHERCFTWLALVDQSLTVLRGYGNINPLSIDYACRPRLRSRLTQGRLA